MRPAICSLAIVSLMIGTDGVYAAAPKLSHVTPSGGQRSTTVTVTCKGEFAWPVSVSAPGVQAVAAEESGKLQLTIPADFPTDRCWIRLYNAEGASIAVPFLVGSVKESSEQEPNNAPGAAQSIPDLPVTINGVLEGADVDGFSVTLMEGQTLVAALDANTRLGSPMDAILQVASPAGNVLAENHDDVGLDPRLTFRAPASGTYVVRLFAFPSAPDSSIAFRGGDSYIYRLTLTTGPYITHAAPMTVPRDDPGEVEVFGWNIPAGTRLPVQPFSGGQFAAAEELEPQAELRLSAERRLGLVSSPEFAGSARVRLAAHPVATAIVPAETREPLPITAPGAVTGWLRSALQVDSFQLPLNKGQQLLVIAEGRGLHMPVDPVLRLHDPSGAGVANFDNPAPARIGVLAHTAAADGDYRLTLRDRYRLGSERSFYQLTMRLEAPDFELTCGDESVVVTPDKPTELTVNVVRRAPAGATVGPITIEAVDLPPGVTAAAVVSEPTGPTAEKVTLSLATTGEQAFSGAIRVAGTTTDPNGLQRFARTPARLDACWEAVWLTAIPKPAAE